MRLRRKSSASGAAAEAPTEETSGAADPASSGDPSAPADPRAGGPWDTTERPVDEADPARAYLGSLSIPGRADVELRLQVDAETEAVAAVMLVGEDGAMELRPFAAPRNHDLWADIRPQIAAEATRLGGRVGDVEGPFGPALRLAMPAATPEGEPGLQQSLVVGISGPRWLLRVSMFGRPAVTYDPSKPLETTLAETIVIRGTGPMSPGEALELRLPKHAVQVGGRGAAGSEGESTVEP